MVIDFDNSWLAVHRPGIADNFFDYREINRSNPAVRSFDPVNCYWLSELCRLVYRSANSTSEFSGPGRQEILARQNLKEVSRIDFKGMQAAIIEQDSNRFEKFALLVFRGSSELSNWFINMQLWPRKWHGAAMVHSGFYKAFYHIWNKVQETLPENRELFYAGHSLGGVMAVLAALMRPPRAVYTFGAPRPGSAELVNLTRGVQIFRVVNNTDIVTALPTHIWPLNYKHAGTLVYIGHNSSITINPSPEEMVKDRQQDSSLRRPAVNKNYLPQCLADHAPVNYSAHLIRNIESQRASQVITLKFDPYNDRFARDIRNGFSTFFVYSLEHGSLPDVQNKAASLREKTDIGTHLEYIDDRLERYEKAFHAIKESGSKDPVHKALVLWDEGLFFEVHELLEKEWLQTKGERKKALQGLIRAAGMYVHLEQGNMVGAQRMAEKAADALDRFGDHLQIRRLNSLLECLRQMKPVPPRLNW